MEGEKASPSHGDLGSATILSAVAGAVDGLGYVVLFELFTAHITGNTVKSGAELGRLHLLRALRDGFPIPVFVAGVLAGAALRDALERQRARARPIVLAVGFALLSAFVGGGAALEGGVRLTPGSGAFYALATLATLAMGIQNAVKPRVGGSKVRTFITGTMSDFGEAVAAALVAATPGDRRGELRRAGLLLAVWLAYYVGAVVAGGAATRFGTAAAVLPLAGLAVAIAVELRAPRVAAAASPR